MNLKVLGWAGFVFLAAGILILIFGPVEWKSFGCGALLTAATLYVTGLVIVVRHIARIKHAANEMMRRVAEDMEKRKKG
jgi:hypothetical protein